MIGQAVRNRKAAVPAELIRFRIHFRIWHRFQNDYVNAANFHRP